MTTIMTAIGLIILTSGIPAAFIASSSSLSPIFPKEIRAARRIASGERHECLSGIEEELCQHINRQTFSHEVVDKFPKELHHQDENADDERSHEERQKILKNVYVKPFEH